MADAPAIELATAYLSIVPSMSGVQGAIAREIDSPGVRKAADAGGRRAGGRMGASFRAALGPLVTAGAIVGIKNLATNAVNSFSELEDSTAAAGVVFGKNMGQIIAQSKTASTSLGLSKQQVINAANTFGTYGKAAGLSGKDLADFATQQTALAADMASFKGTSPEQAIEAIGAALRGESEPIRAYGVMLDDATLKNRALKMGLIETTKDALTPQQKTLAAQQEILAQTSDAQGDFARTSESTANVQKTLAAQTEDLQAKIGGKLAPAFTAVRKVASKVLTKFSTALDAAEPKLDKLAGAAKDLWGQFGPTLKRVVPQVTAIASAFSPFGIAVKAIGPVLPQVGDSLGKIAAAVGGVLAEVLPTVADAFAGVGTALAGAISQALPSLVPLFESLADVIPLFGPALSAMAGALGGVATWLVNMAGSLAGNKTLVVTLVTAWGAWRVAVAAHTAAIKLAGIATKVWTGITKAAAIGQKLLNAAMKANPIGLVITGITLLVGALVWFFTKTKLGKKIVAVAWAGIKAAIKGVADWWTKTAWPAIKRVIVAFGDGFKAVKRVIGTAMTGIVGFFKSAPGKIKKAFGSGWNFLKDKLTAVVGSYSSGKGLLGRVKGVVDFFSGLGGRLSRAAGSLFGFLSDKLRGTVGKYASGGGGVKGALWGVVHFIKSTLPGKIRAAAKNIWTGLAGNALDVVGSVMKLVGKIPGVNGSITLAAAGARKTYKYADGGVMPGYTPGRDVHQFFSPTGGLLELSGGEPILRPEAGRVLGSSWVHGINAAARGGGISGVRQFLGGGQAFADGGLWGMEKFRAPDSLPALVKTLVNATLGKLTVPSLLNAVGEKVFDSLLGDRGDGDVFTGGKLGAGGRKGMGVAAMTRALHALIPGAVVTSGFRGGAMTVTGFPSYHGLGRAIDIVPGSSGLSMGQIWDRLMGAYGKVAPEIFFSGRNFSRFGKLGRKRNDHWDHVHWAMKNGGVLPKLYDQGGWVPDKGMALNLSGKPEAVLDPEESAGLKAALDGGLGGRGDTWHVYGTDEMSIIAGIERTKVRAKVRANLAGRRTR